jgi:hypothetical protein
LSRQIRRLVSVAAVRSPGVALIPLNDDEIVLIGLELIANNYSPVGPAVA